MAKNTPTYIQFRTLLTSYVGGTALKLNDHSIQERQLACLACFTLQSTPNGSVLGS